MDPPPGQETADAYYVVDHGREVGIFTDKYVVLLFSSIVLMLITSTLSTRAVRGVAHGHQVKVKTLGTRGHLPDRQMVGLC